MCMQNCLSPILHAQTLKVEVGNFFHLFILCFHRGFYFKFIECKPCDILHDIMFAELNNYYTINISYNLKFSKLKSLAWEITETK